MAKIKDRAKELSQNKVPFSTKLSPKAVADLDEIIKKTGYSKALITELAYEFLLEKLEKEC